MQAGEGLVFAAVIYKVCRIAVVLQLLVITSRVYKWSVNPFNNPNPVYSHILPLTI
jgi:hypothetical protein